jgi:hypothetical protein
LIKFYYFALLKLHIKNYHIKYLISTFYSICLFTPTTIHHSPSIVNHCQPSIAADTYKIKKEIKLKIFLKFRKESEISKLIHMSKTQKLKAETYKIEKRKIKKKNFFLKKFQSVKYFTSKLTYISNTQKLKAEPTK